MHFGEPGEGDGVALVAFATLEPREDICQDAAPNVRSELLLDVAWEGIVIREGVEGVEGGQNSFVEEGVLWGPWEPLTPFASSFP